MYKSYLKSEREMICYNMSYLQSERKVSRYKSNLKSEGKVTWKSSSLKSERKVTWYTSYRQSVRERWPDSQVTWWVEEADQKVLPEEWEIGDLIHGELPEA